MIVFQVFRETLYGILSDRRSLWWHIGLLTLGPFFLALSWPDGNLQGFLETEVGPKVFSTITLVIAIFIFGSGGVFSLDRLPGEPGYAFDRWIRFTPVGVFSYLHGRILFHLVHSLLLALLVLPSLLIAATGSLALPRQALSVLGILFFISLCQRIASEAGRRTTGPTGSLAYLVYFLVLISYLLLSFATLPQWSVIRILQEITTNRGGGLRRISLIKTLSLHLIIAVLGYVLTIWRLSRTARVARAV